MVEPIGESTFGPRVGHELLASMTTRLSRTDWLRSHLRSFRRGGLDLSGPPLSGPGRVWVRSVESQILGVCGRRSTSRDPSPGQCSGVSSKRRSGRRSLRGEEKLQQNWVDDFRGADVGPVPTGWDQCESCVRHRRDDALGERDGDSGVGFAVDDERRAGDPPEEASRPYASRARAPG